MDLQTENQNILTRTVKKSLIGWWLFDFAYSISTVIGGIYFTKWFTENLGANSMLLNLLFLVSTFFVILTGRYVGRRIDLYGYKSWIIVSSILGFFSILFLFLGSQLFDTNSNIILSFIFFIIFLFGYQVGRICHNVYLRKVIPEIFQSKMSGLGVAANWSGSVIGIVISVPIVTNQSFSVMYARELTFLIASLTFVLIVPYSLYLMFLIKEKPDNKVLPSSEKISFIRYFSGGLGVYFIVYFLLYDVMTIVQRNLPAFLSQVFRMPDNYQAVAFLLILLSATTGGLISAKFLTHKNSVDWLKTFTSCLGLSIILITLNNNVLLWGAFIIAGISYGVIESAIRLNFMYKFQAKHAGENFGVLAIIERASGIAGPLLWIAAFSISKTETHSYLFSMRVMGTLAFTALVIILLLFKKGTTPAPHTIDNDLIM